MSPDLCRHLLREMMRIRAVEETIAERYSEEKMRCPTHLSIGQEAPAAAAGAVLMATDMAVSGHRAHAHYLAKGGNIHAMIAEIYGKVTGCSRGKGGIDRIEVVLTDKQNRQPMDGGKVRGLEKDARFHYRVAHKDAHNLSLRRNCAR